VGHIEEGTDMWKRSDKEDRERKRRVAQGLTARRKEAERVAKEHRRAEKLQDARLRERQREQDKEVREGRRRVNRLIAAREAEARGGTRRSVATRNVIEWMGGLRGGFSYWYIKGMVVVLVPVVLAAVFQDPLWLVSGFVVALVFMWAHLMAKR
jgi:hypothetical protein